TVALTSDSVGADFASAMVTAINNQTSTTGVTAVNLASSDTGVAGNSIALVNTTGAAINVSVATAQLAAAGASGFEVFNTAGVSLAAGANGQITYTAPLGDASATITGN